MSKRVYAFEPSKTTFEFLEKNISRSGLRNVVPMNFGLGGDPGKFTLTFAPSNRSGGFVSNHTKASSGHTTETVVIRKMDEVLESNQSRVSFIKIDVEGFEGHVLRGATQTLASHRPIVVLELNHWCLNAFQRTSIPDFFDFLRSIFPILLAVDNTGNSYLDLHSENEGLLGLVWVKMHVNQIFGSMQVRTFSRRYSSSRSPYARRWMTRILLLSPSTKPSETLFFGLQ